MRGRDWGRRHGGHCKQHLDNLRRKDSLRGAETTEISVRLRNYSASHFEGSAYYLTPNAGCAGAFTEPSLGELARVIKAGACIEASLQRGKGEAGMDAYQVRIWEGWHHHMALTLIAVWFLIGETHRGQQLTPALPLPHVRYGLSVLLREVFCTPGVDSMCRQVQRQLLRNELARFYVIAQPGSNKERTGERAFWMA